MVHGRQDGFTAAEVRAAEAPLLAAGVPLMARAAAGLAAEVRRILATRGRRIGRVLVLAGSGSNGGDALLAAAALVADGGSAVVVPLGPRVHRPGLAAAVRAGASVLPRDATAGRIVAEAMGADVVLDGLLGTGAASSPRLRAPARQVVARLAEALPGGPAVLAVDLPSGLGPDDGAVHPPVLRADVTVTFGGVKRGLLLPPGRSLAGTVRLVEIGIALAPGGAPSASGVRQRAPRERWDVDPRIGGAGSPTGRGPAPCPPLPSRS